MISLIAAISENNIIGNENKLLWHIPEDMKRFKTLTLNHPVVMGRRTYDSIGHPLPNRTNIIVTRDQHFKVFGAIVVHSIDEAIAEAKKYVKDYSSSEVRSSQEIFVIGGGQVYAQAIGAADKLYLTVVKGTYAGDTKFPDYSRFSQVAYKKEGVQDNVSYTFFELLPKLS
jgi:dihydrofolate reductase